MAYTPARDTNEIARTGLVCNKPSDVFLALGALLSDEHTYKHQPYSDNHNRIDFMPAKFVLSSKKR
jgi:hypothetical protein